MMDTHTSKIQKKLYRTRQILFMSENMFHAQRLLSTGRGRNSRIEHRNSQSKEQSNSISKLQSEIS